MKTVFGVAWTAMGLALALVATAASATAGPAERFDFVVVDHMLAKAYLGSDPIVAAVAFSFSCGLVVNTGGEAIPASEISGMRVAGTMTSGDIPWGLRTFFMDSSVGETSWDVLPNEAIGHVNVWNDTTLLTLLLPGETFRDTGLDGWQFGGWVYCRRDYEGTSYYDVEVTLGECVVRFPVRVDVVQVPTIGERGLEVLGVARVSSSPIVPTSRTTWGALKSLYR